MPEYGDFLSSVSDNFSVGRPKDPSSEPVFILIGKVQWLIGKLGFAFIKLLRTRIIPGKFPEKSVADFKNYKTSNG